MDIPPIQTPLIPSIFIDTNVLLDHLQMRAGMENAEKILELGRKREIRICISTISVVNIAYIMRKMMPLETIKTIFHDWINAFVILSNGLFNVYDAVRGNHPDFEDAIQLACSESEQCVAIVTNNKKHFAPYTDTPVFTPDEFLAKLRGEPATP